MRKKKRKTKNKNDYHNAMTEKMDVNKIKQIQKNYIPGSYFRFMEYMPF